MGDNFVSARLSVYRHRLHLKRISAAIYQNLRRGQRIGGRMDSLRATVKVHLGRPPRVALDAGCLFLLSRFSVFLSISLPFFLSVFLAICLAFYRSCYLFLWVFLFRSFFLYLSLTIFLYVYLSFLITLSFFSIFLFLLIFFFYLSSPLFIFLSPYLLFLFFGRVHATLQPALSISWLVTLYFFL